MKRDEAIVLVLLLAAAALAFLTILVVLVDSTRTAIIVPMATIWGTVIAGAFALLRGRSGGPDDRE